MSLGVLNNTSATYAANTLNRTSNSLSAALLQLSSGSKINTGSDDAAGLSLVNGLRANSQALAQSQINTVEGVGMLKVVDGAISQVNSLLNRAITLATEASTGTLSSAQYAAANQEYQSLLAEISNVGTATTYNQKAVFNSSTNIYTGDSSTGGASVNTLNISALSASNIGDTNGVVSYTAASPGSAATISYTASSGQSLSGSSIIDQTHAQATLTDINAAISNLSAQDGYIGAQINTLNAISQILTTQQETVVSAQDAVQATDYAEATSQMAKYQILMKTGVSALAQTSNTQQEISKLLQ